MLQHVGAPLFGCRACALFLCQISLLDVCDIESTLPPAWTTTSVLDSSQRWSCGQKLLSLSFPSVFLLAQPADLHFSNPAAQHGNGLRDIIQNPRWPVECGQQICSFKRKTGYCVFQRHGREGGRVYSFKLSLPSWLIC